MAVVKQHTPSAGKGGIAQMLAQRAQPPAMPAPPPQPLNGMRGMPPTPLMRPPLPPMAAAPAGAPTVAGGMPAETVPAALKQAMLARMFGGGGPGGAPPIGR